MQKDVTGFGNVPRNPSPDAAVSAAFCTSDALIIVKGWVELLPNDKLVEFTYRKHYLCLDCHQRWSRRTDARKHLLTAQDRRA